MSKGSKSRVDDQDAYARNHERIFNNNRPYCAIYKAIIKGDNSHKPDCPAAVFWNQATPKQKREIQRLRQENNNED